MRNHSGSTMFYSEQRLARVRPTPIPKPQAMERSLQTYRFPASLPRQLVSMWQEGYQDAEDDCLDDFLEDKLRKIEECLKSTKVEDLNPGLASVLLTEPKRLQVAVVEILQTDEPKCQRPRRFAQFRPIWFARKRLPGITQVGKQTTKQSYLLFQVWELLYFSQYRSHQK